MPQLFIHVEFLLVLVHNSGAIFQTAAAHVITSSALHLLSPHVTLVLMPRRETESQRLDKSAGGAGSAPCTLFPHDCTRYTAKLAVTVACQQM